MSHPPSAGFKESSLTPYKFVHKLSLSRLAYNIPGFEDVLGGELLGEGTYHNTCGTVRQLCGAIALSGHASATEMLQLGSSDDRDEVTQRVAKLRFDQVLSGMRILDLGCGVPYFAAAATALGATTYTADAEDFTARFPDQPERHIVVDLREEEAVEKIREKAGDSLDYVTEQIISPLPSQHYLAQPSRFAILDIAKPLLRRGGILLALTHGLSEQVFERT